MHWKHFYILLFLKGAILQCVNSKPVLLQLHQVDITTSTDAEITSPGYEDGQYPELTECRWDITASQSKKIQVLFQDFDVEYHRFCIWDSVTVYNDRCDSDTKHVVTKLCGVKQNYQVLSEGNFLCIAFVSDQIVNKKGFKAIATIIQEMNKTAVDNTTKATDTTTSQLSTPHATSQSVVSNSSTSLPTLGATSTHPPTSKSSSASLPNAPPSQTSTSSSTSYSASPSNSLNPPTSSLSSSTSQSPSTTRPASKLTAAFTSTNPHTSTLISASSSSPSHVIATIPSTTTTTATTTEQHQHTKSSTQASTTTVLPENSNSNNFNFTICESDQDEVIASANADIFISSPKDANGKYPVNRHCVLTVQNQAKRMLKIEFLQFQLEYQLYCSWDYVTLFTPGSSGQLCGSTTPSTIETMSNNVKIVFHSDPVVPDVGFTLRIRAQNVLTSSSSLTTSSITTTESTTSVSPHPTTDGIASQFTSSKSTTDVLQPNFSSTFSDSSASPVAAVSASVTSVTETASHSLSTSLQPASTHTNTNVSTPAIDNSLNSPTTSLTSTKVSTLLPLTSLNPATNTTPTTDKSLMSPATSITTSTKASTTALLNPSQATSITTSTKASTTALLNPSQATSITTSTKASTTTLLNPSSATPITTSTSLPNPTTYTAHSDKPTTIQNTSPQDIVGKPLPVFDICQTSEITVTDRVTLVTPRFLENSKYPLNVGCSTTVTSPPQMEISMQLETFDLEMHPSCAWDSLQVQHAGKDIKLCGLFEQSESNEFKSCYTDTFVAYNAVDVKRICEFNKTKQFEFQDQSHVTFFFTSDYVMPMKGFNITLFARTKSIHFNTTSTAAISKSVESTAKTSSSSEFITTAPTVSEQTDPITNLPKKQSSFIQIPPVSEISMIMESSLTTKSASNPSSNTVIGSTLSTTTSASPPILTSTSANPPIQTSTSASPPIQTSTSASPPILTTTSSSPPIQTSTSASPPILTTTSASPPIQTSTSVPEVTNVESITTEHVEITKQIYTEDTETTDNNKATTNVPTSAEAAQVSPEEVPTITSLPDMNTTLYDETNSKKQAVVNMCEADSIYVTDDTTLVSPGYFDKQNYPLNTVCSLKVTSPPETELFIILHRFNLEINPTCSWDNLVIQYGLESLHVCGSLTHDTDPSVQTSCLVVNSKSMCALNENATFELGRQHEITLTFTSDNVVAMEGFNLTISVKYVSSIEEKLTATSTVTPFIATTTVREDISASSDAILPITLTTLTTAPTTSSATYISKSTSSPTLPPKTPAASTLPSANAEQNLSETSTSASATLNPIKTKITTSLNTVSKPAETSAESSLFKSSIVSTITTLVESSTSSLPIITSVETSPVTSTQLLHLISTNIVNVPKQTTTDPVSTHSSSVPSVIPTSTGGALTQACNNGEMPYLIVGQSGYIESPGYSSMPTYPPNISCKWKIEYKKDQVILIRFTNPVDIEYSTNCKFDKLALYELDENGSDMKEVDKWCGNVLPNTVTSQTDVIIQFSTDSMFQNRGFKLEYIITEASGISGASITCPPAMTPCWSSATCIPIEWLCDGENDCNDGTDENICPGCEANEFACGNGKCLPMSQRCNGVVDCQYGLDEQECVTITNRESSLIGVDISGNIHPLCYNDDVMKSANELCKTIGYRWSESVWFKQSPYQHHATLSGANGDNVNMQFSIRDSCEDVTYIKCSGQDCGVKDNIDTIRRKRVIGGSISSSGDWPWSVAIKVGNTVVCGGTIIDSLWVMTAGHCVQDLAYNPQATSITAGVNDLSDIDRQTRYVTEVVIHPDYFYIYNSDIALLRLHRPLVFNSKVKQICLPWDKRQFSPKAKCVVAGWGISDMKDYYTTVAPRFLRHVKTKIVNADACREIYSYKTEIKDTMLCAGYMGGGMDACKGDSGGGLMCEGTDGRWVQAGVVSWGDMCGNTNRPGVYTKVTSFVDWIDTTLGTTNSSNINCTFEAGDWCGYIGSSNDSYIWTRKPGGKDIPGSIMYAVRSGVDENYPANATLLTPEFNTYTDSCLTFSFMFSGNSNITLSVYGDFDVQDDRGDMLLWQITSHYPAKETWKVTEAHIPKGVGTLRFVSQHEHGGISGLGLDNVTLTPSPCRGSDFLKCNFNDGTLCQYSSPSNSQGLTPWQIKHKDKTKNDYTLKAGGNFGEFGFMAISQLLSPILTDAFTSLPHCLKFSYNKNKASFSQLEVAMYVEIGGQLGNQQVFWGSQGAVIGSWVSVQVVVSSGYYDFIVFEVRRSSYTTDTVDFWIDDITINDGYCV